MHKGKGFQYKLTKRPGAALLGTVLVSLIILAIFSLVAFNIAMQTMRIERWQAEHYEDQRLQYLARSGVMAFVGAMDKAVTNGFSFDNSTNAISQSSTAQLTDAERGLAASVDFIVSADANSNNIRFIVKAYDANNNIRKIRALYDQSTKKITEWRVIK